MRLSELLRRAAQVMAAAYQKEGASLTLPQLAVLRTLKAAPGPISQTTLTRETSIDRSTLGPLLRLLQADGLIIRARNSDDARAMDVEITGAGRRELAAHEAGLRAAEEAVLKLVPRAERPSMCKALEALAVGLPREGRR